MRNTRSSFLTSGVELPYTKTNKINGYFKILFKNFYAHVDMLKKMDNRSRFFLTQVNKNGKGNKNRKLNGSDNIYDFMTNYVFIHT